MPTASAPTKLKISDFVIPDTVDLDALTRGDDDVTHVIARFEAPTPSDANVLTRLLELAQQGRLNGTAGHQDKATISTAFPTVKVHWISARLDGQVFSFLGVIDAAARDEKRWVRAGRLHVEPFQHGAAVSLDLMPRDRSPKSVPALLGTEDDAGAGGDAQATTDTKDTNGTESEAEMAGLRLVKKSTTPYGEIGTYVRPIGYGDDYNNAEQDITNEIMSGMTVRRRSL